MNRFQILSLDGGGIRGAFAAAFLEQLEKELGGPIRRYFDLVAGTSTGGIIALAVALDEPMSRVVDFYRNMGPVIFTRRSPRRLGWKGKVLRRCMQPLLARYGINFDDLIQTRYDSAPLIAALRDVFGSRTLLDAKTRVLIPAVDLSQGAPVVFKSPHLGDANSRDRHFSAAEIALATAAAPTYFPHAVMGPGSAYSDGGLWANNPVLLSLAETARLGISTEEVLLLSVGTGKGRYSIAPPDSQSGLAWWGPRLIEVISHSQSEGAMRVAEFMVGDQCVRVDFDLPDGTWELDSVDRVDRLVHFGREAAHRQLAALRATFFNQTAAECNWKAPTYGSLPAVAGRIPARCCEAGT